MRRKLCLILAVLMTWSMSTGFVATKNGVPITKGTTTAPAQSGPNGTSEDDFTGYERILDQAYYLAQDPNGGKIFFDGDTGIGEAARMSTPEEALEHIGYALVDMNKDGSKELLIGYINDTKKNMGSLIYGMYALNGGNPNMILEGWARCRYEMGRNNAIYLNGSSGAIYSIFGKYEVSGDDLLNCVDYYFTCEKNGNYEDIRFYHNNTGIWNVESSEELKISEDKFWKIQEDMLNQITAFKMKPLSGYVPVYSKAFYEEKCPIKVQFARDVKIPEAGYEECIAVKTGKTERVVLTSNHYLMDFQVLKIDNPDYDENGNVRFEAMPIYAYGMMDEYNPLVVQLAFPGDTPHYAVSYMDNDDTVHYYAIDISGMDGKPYLWEIQAISAADKYFQWNDGGIYIFPGSDKKLLGDMDVVGKELFQLRRGINEIYARHGRGFNNEGQYTYFLRQDWYEDKIPASAFNENTLSKIEKQNIEFLQKKLNEMTKGINVTQTEKAVAKFLMEPGVNAFLGTRFNSVKDFPFCIGEIVYQLTDDSVDYKKLWKNVEKKFGEVDTDITYISSLHLDQFLRKVTGYGIGEKDWDFEHVNYDEALTVYYVMHGDTNYMPLTCELVGIHGDEIVMLCYPHFYYDDSPTVVTVVKDKNGYKLLSCQ